MRLVKSCRPEHNVRTTLAAQIQLGTFNYYRAHENQEIADSLEASNSLAVSIRGPIKIPARFYNALVGERFSFEAERYPPICKLPTALETHVKILRVRLGDPVLVFEAEFDIHRALPNGFTFCMSQLDDASIRPFQSYEDSWSIPWEKADLFAWHLGRMVAMQHEPGWFEPRFLEDWESGKIAAGKLVFNTHHRAVLYSDRELKILSGTEDELNKVFTRIRTLAFTKPSHFAPEREYRFLVNAVCEHPDGTRTIYLAGKDYIRLNCDIPWRELS
ncbi:hypothetical protein BOTU111921_11490 [Bordetella tumbae]|uniref:hypothetical protein n=1 Tax=Bordetella tumbae TaxID=1649139 RepID=UPI0039F009D7